jgi:PAS domain-containing protein
MANPSPKPAQAPPAVLTAGPVPYLWLLWSVLLVVVLDQVGANATVPAHQQFPLLNLGLAAALAVLWQLGWKAAPAVLVAGLASGALRHLGWVGTPLYALGLVGGAGAGRALLALTGFDARLRNAADVLTLAVLAGPTASVIMALAAALLPGAGAAGHGGFTLAFLAQWLAGWTGVLMMTPFIFSLGEEYFRRWPPARVREWLLVNLLLTGSVLVLMQNLTAGDVALYPLAYLALPCVFWTAWRFGTAGAALANLLVGIVTSLCAKEGLGPFAGSEGLLILLPAWVFLLFHGLVALLLAAFTDERRMELLLQRQRARFLRQLLDELPLGVLLKDITDQPLLVNRRWFQMFGKAGGNEEDQLKHQKSMDAFWRGRELTLLQNLGEVLREETESKDHQGRALELLLTKQAAYFEERGERLLMVVADDISSGRASLNEARAILEKIRATLAVAEVGLWDWHIPSGIIRFDAEFSKLTDIPEHPEGLPVPVWQNDIHPDDRRTFQHDMLQHLHHQAELFATRFRFKRAGGWIWLVVRGRVVEQDSRNLGIRMIGTIQHLRATVQALPDPNAPTGKS